MPNTAVDPLDHANTTCHFTGEALKDARHTIGLILAALGVLALAVSLNAFAMGSWAGGALAAAAAVLLGAAGSAWVLVEHHRVVKMEVRWLAEHPRRQ